LDEIQSLPAKSSHSFDGSFIFVYSTGLLYVRYSELAVNGVSSKKLQMIEFFSSDCISEAKMIL
jgi:hypothetical protein